MDLEEIIARLKAIRQRIEYVNSMSNEERIIQETFKDMEALKETVGILERMRGETYR